MIDADDILIAMNLRKSYGKSDTRTEVLRGLDLSVRRGEFLAIMGPSGCGKSTLLHVLGLLTPPDDGELTIDGEQIYSTVETDEDLIPLPIAIHADLTRVRRDKIGIVFQRFNLISVLTAVDNVAISLRVRGLVMDRGHVEALFASLGVGHVANRKPGSMSIGEQQRVAVARAMAHRPAILLADEPTGNLDSANSQSLLEIFRRINRQDRQTIVMITHSAEAAAFADRVVQMKDGRLVQP